MDTVTEITVVSSSKKEAQGVFNSADSLLSNWEQRFSVSGDSSEVRKLNERYSDTVVVSLQLGKMVAKGVRYGDTLNGMFDITILPLKELWGLGENSPDSQAPPTAEQLISALGKVDYHSVKVSDSYDTIIFANSSVDIDVGGIAKGEVLQELESLIKRRSIQNFLISAGGDIVASGQRYDKKPWMVAIQHPRSSDSYLGVVTLDSGSIVTSGDYERFRIIDNKRVHHIFSPKDGMSCTKNQSVTVYGNDPVEIDILSTGLFCEDAAAIIRFVEKRPHLRAAVVDSTGKVFVSRSWQALSLHQQQNSPK